jgi:hypothetical protein
MFSLFGVFTNKEKRPLHCKSKDRFAERAKTASLKEQRSLGCKSKDVLTVDG